MADNTDGAWVVQEIEQHRGVCRHKDLDAIPSSQQVFSERGQRRWMDMVFRLLNPDQVTPSLAKKRGHKRKHAQGAAGSADLVHGIPQPWFMLDEVDLVLGLLGFAEFDL